LKRYVKESAAIRNVMRLLSVEGPTGKEGGIAGVVLDELGKVVPVETQFRQDGAHTRIPLPTEVGNLIFELPGKGSLAGARMRLFCAHLDTVALACGAKPVRKGNEIRAKGSTALGADDRAGCAVLLTLAQTLARLDADARPVVLAFTVREESGLWGARYIDRRVLKKCDMGFCFDGGSPSELVVGAPSACEMVIDIEGLASHAGAHPDEGVSAAVIFAEAVSSLAQDGWLGRIVTGDQIGTSNIGIVTGGDATNIVMPHLRAMGEARSYDEAFLQQIVEAFSTRFEAAAKRTKNVKGASGKASVRSSLQYRTFDLGDDAPVVREAETALSRLGLDAKRQRLFGGLDANWLNAYGLPTVTLGTGAHNPHTVGEYLDIGEFLTSCEIAIRLATSLAD
jgi:tripeptide aminopeptidase